MTGKKQSFVADHIAKVKTWKSGARFYSQDCGMNVNKLSVFCRWRAT
jgi:hypothetical protein